MRSFSRRENPLKREIYRKERSRRGQAKTITMKEVKVKAISRTNKARVTNCHRRKKSVTTMWIHYLYQVPHWGNWEFLLEIHFLNIFWELSKWCNRRSNFILQSATKCHRVLRVLFKLSTPPRPSCHASITLSIYLCGYGKSRGKRRLKIISFWHKVCTHYRI